MKTKDQKRREAETRQIIYDCLTLDQKKERLEQSPGQCKKGWQKYLRLMQNGQ